MAKLPGFMFYPGDWVKDPDLSRCSKAAKGMWIDMICKAFECKERGKFSSAQIPWTREEIAGAVGGDATENLEMLDELISKGVAKIDKRGAIFCERMMRDERIRQIRSEAGELGGRPSKYQKKEVVIEKSKIEANSKANSKQNTEYENENILVVKNLETKKKANYEDVKLFCSELSLPDSDSEYFFNHWEGNGWTNGGKPIKDWKRTIRAWKAAGHLPSQKNVIRENEKKPRFVV